MTRIASRAGIFALLIAAGRLVVGCGGVDAPPARALAFEELIPDGTDTIVYLRPRELLADDATMRVAEAIIPATRFDAFRARHGVDVRELEALAIATFDDVGTVVLGRGPFHADVVVTEIGHRMSPLESSSDTPRRRRAGIYRMRRFELIALAPHDVALVDGPPALAGLVVHTRERAPASERAHTSAPGVGSFVHRVLERARAPLVVAHEGSFDLPPEGIGLVLARLRGAALVARPAGAGDPGAIALEAWLVGEFPPGADENLRTFVASLSEADLGRAVGLEEAAHTLAIESVVGEIRLSARIRASTVARGLRVLLGAEIEEMLDGAT